MDVADVASRGIEELDAEFVIRDGERTAADTAVMLAQILSTSSAGSAGLCSSYKIQVHFLRDKYYIDQVKNSLYIYTKY